MGYNKGRSRCPRPPFPPLQTFRGKGKETVLTSMDTSPLQQTCPQICFPSTELKQAEKYFFPCLLSVYFLLLPLCLQQRRFSLSPRTCRCHICCPGLLGCAGAAPPLQPAELWDCFRLGVNRQNTGKTNRGSQLGGGLSLDETYHLSCAFSRCLRNGSFKLLLYELLLFFFFQVSLLLSLFICCLLDRV